MKKTFILFATIIAFNLIGCTSPEEMKDEADAEYTMEKTETLKEYKECVQESEGAEGKMAMCEAILKAVEAVEGNAQ